MIDFKAVAVSGAVSLGKARALWDDDLLKLYGKDGLIMSMGSTHPVRRKGWINTHDVETTWGLITLKSKCWTCGGWWRVVRQSADTLWNG